MSPSKNRASPFRPTVKRMDVDIKNVLMIITVSVLVFMLIIPISRDSDLTIVSEFQLEEPRSLSQDLLFYSLPDTNIRVATGEISGYRGFAYVIEEESRLYFVDLINEVTLDIALPAGVKGNGAYLKGYDVDLDGDTEFFLRNVVGGINWYILMVDIDDGFVAEYPMPFIWPAPMGFGIFNGDAFPDVLVQNVNNRDNFLTLDVINNLTIGLFNADYAFVNPAIGRFTGTSSDSIAIVNSMGTSGQRNLTVVEPDGTQVQNILLTPSVQDMVTFNYLGGLEEIATIDSNGDIVVYNGLTLGVNYTQNADPLSSTTRFIETGDFNVDAQDDLVVISRTQEKAYFRDGNLGFPIREVDGIWTHSQREFDVGRMDQDSTDELAIGTTYGGLGIIRGADGNFANLEYLLDVQNVAHQIMTFDYNGDSWDDVVVRIEDGVWIVISDATPPILMPLPIDPVHPTVLDDYVTIEVDVSESSSIEYIDIWMRLPGSSVWMQPQDEMYSSSTPGLYYAFIGNLQPGEYDYYVNVQDSYLNLGSLGNVTHPEKFSVSGNFVWKIDKTETDHVHKRFHQSDLGNESDGSSLIYTIERAKAELDLTLWKYSEDGSKTANLTIVNPAAIPFDNFALFTAMLNGDNIQDIIVLDLYYDKNYVFRYHAYDGNSFSLIDNGTIPFAYKSFNYMGVFDDDGDGYEELFIASDTQPYNLIKMDSDLTWTSVDLPNSGDNRYGVRGFTVITDSPTGYIGVVRGDIEIDILSTDLVYSHSLDIDLSAYGNIEFGGINKMFNATLGKEQFVASYTYWDASDPTGRVYVFDSETTNVNNTPVYQLDHQYITYFYPVDATGDGIDDLFIKLPNDLLLAEFGSSLITRWTTPITGATPLSATVADFDGDAMDEFILFTDQDEILSQVSFTGVVEWIMVVGEVYNPLVLGNIEQTPGVEIAAYPFATVTSYTIGAIRNLDSQYVLDVFVEYGSADIVQGDPFWANVTVANIYGEIIDDSSVYMSAHHISNEGPIVDTFGFYFDWPSMKYRAVTDATWPIGIANLSVSIDHDYYHPYEHTFVDAVTIKSQLHVAIDAPPFVNQGDNMSIVVWVLDNLDGIVEDATVSITLDGVGQAATQSGPFYVVDYPEVQIDAGFHLASATAVHPFGLSTGTGERPISVQIPSESLIVSTDFPDTVFQDERVSAWFNITDQYDAPMEGAIVTLVSGPRGFELVESSVPGCYSFERLMNLELGNQTFELRINLPNIVGGIISEIEFDVMGDLDFFVTFSPEEPVQGQPLFVSVVAVDGLGKPVPDLELYVHLMNLPPLQGYPGDQLGEYVAMIEHIPLTEGYGLFNVTIEAVGQYALMSTSMVQVNIAPATPDFSMISTDTIGLGAGASFLLSMIGMVIYFRMSASMRVDDESEEKLKKTVRNMDRLYLVIVIASGFGLVSSYGMYQSGEYGLALILTVALLGASVLLYGLWLYRDAMSAVLVHRRLSRKRMIMGLWHLVFVPVVIVLILLYGEGINWFKAFIIDQTYTFGDIVIPTIMTTIFTAYLSSILVVVVNLYREVSKGLKKLTKMEEAGTPESIVQDEKTSMVRRFSSSIRIKFLMFLVVVGATTVMSMDFLASWELGIIILLPVAFLVVIPFISSKIIQVLSKMSKGKIPTAPVEP
ncbi:MAG: hypothetical protein ACFFEW_07515 [Candidatus Thorarchaeota archaeon]